MQYTVEADDDGTLVTVEQLLDIAQMAAFIVQDPDQPLRHGDLAEALFSAGMIDESEYDSYIG